MACVRAHHPLQHHREGDQRSCPEAPNPPCRRIRNVAGTLRRRVQIYPYLRQERVSPQVAVNLCWKTWSDNVITRIHGLSETKAAWTSIAPIIHDPLQVTVPQRDSTLSIVTTLFCPRTPISLSPSHFEARSKPFSHTK